MTVTATDAEGTIHPCVITLGKKPEEYPDDSDEEDDVKNKYWDCYFWVDKVTKVTVTGSVVGRNMAGVPFT